MGTGVLSSEEAPGSDGMGMGLQAAGASTCTQVASTCSSRGAAPLPVHRVPEGTQPSTWTSTLWQYKCLVQPYASRLLAVLLAFIGCCIVWGEMTILSVSESFASDCQPG